MAAASPTPAQERELDRLGAFSDGVFAIAITLLVLNLEVPHVAGSELGAAISDLADDFEAYAIGFAVMGLFWYEHHRLFSRLTRATGRLVLVKVALLATIGIMPFTTAVLGTYNEPLAVSLYAGNVAATIVLNGLLMLIAIDEGLYAPGGPGERSWTRGDVVTGMAARSLVFLVSIPIAYGVSESWAKWLWLLMLVQRLPRRMRALGRRMD